jgi:hypothetical protein
VKKRIAIAISCVVLLACATMLLASAKHSNVSFTSDYKHVMATGGSGHMIPNVQRASGTVIAGNLSSYQYGTYFCCFGNTVAGGANGSFPFQVWEGVAFTPASSATVTELQVAVGSFGSTNPGFDLALYTDNGGVPGTALKSFHIASPPTYGTCCTLDTAKDSAGIAVTGGTQYWIVAKTGGSTGEFLGGWNMNDTDQRPDTYTVASWCKGPTEYCGTTDNGKWVSGENGDPVEAYSVIGN